MLGAAGVKAWAADGSERRKLGGMVGGVVWLAKVAKNDSKVGADEVDAAAGVSFSSAAGAGVSAAAGVDAGAAVVVSVALSRFDSKADGATPKPEKSSSVLRNDQKASSCSAVKAVEGGDDDDGSALSVWR